jgi:hypothetical protein
MRQQGVSDGLPLALASSPAASALPAAVRELDEKGIKIVMELVRKQLIVDLDTVLGDEGLQDASLRDAVLRFVEQHPNLKAHPGPRTIFLQWRNTPSQRAS